MRILKYKNQKGRICTWSVPPYIGEIWDIYIADRRITKIPTYLQYCEFLYLAIRVRVRFPEKFV